MSRIPIATVVIGAMLLGAGCANRPSAAELSESILNAAEGDPTVSVTADQASCIAEQLLATNLSDTTLAGLANDFDNPEVLSAEVDKVEPAVAEAAAACISAG